MLLPSGGLMATTAMRIMGSLARALVVAAVVAIGIVLVAPRGNAVQRGLPNEAGPWMKPVPKAACGPKDRVDTGLQGQTTLAERMTKSSETSYGCNLELVGQFRGEGASWQMAALDTCAYYGTANNPGQQQKGVVVIDASNPAKPFA